jgi:hypothetical protein
VFFRRVLFPGGHAVPYLSVIIGARFQGHFGDLKIKSARIASAIRYSPKKKIPCVSGFQATAGSTLTQQGGTAYSGALFKEAEIARANFSSLGK